MLISNLELEPEGMLCGVDGCQGKEKIMEQYLVGELLLGSSVIAAVITAIFSFIINQKNGKLEYITAERKAWRESMRSIVEEMQGASYKKTLKCIAKLKVRINAYGNNYSQNYMDDTHIWKLIKKIEGLNSGDEVELIESQKRMTEYISLLLKYDWERSKKEVRGNTVKSLSVGFFAFTIIYFIETLIISINGKQLIEKSILMYIAIIILLLISILVFNILPIYIVWENFKYKKGKNKGIHYCLECVGVFAISTILFYVLIKTAYSQTDNYKMQEISIYSIVCAFTYILGEIFLFLSYQDKIDQIIKYEKAIELINNNQDEENTVDNGLQENKKLVNELYYKGVFPVINNILFLIYYVLALVTLPFLYFKTDSSEILVVILSYLVMIASIIVIKNVESYIKKYPAKKQWMIRFEDFSLNMSTLVYLLTSFSYITVFLDKYCFWFIYIVMLGLFFFGLYFYIIKSRGACLKK